MLKLGEKVLLDPMHVEGHVTVQLFDALTGKKVEEQSGKNFLSRALTEKLQRFAQRYVFGHQHPAVWEMAGSGRFREDSDGAGFFHWLILTNSALPEDPASEHVVPGAIIGYCNRQTHSDVDLRRGAINRAEVSHTPAQTRWVMDWATDRGNGTFQSVCWAPHHHLGDTALEGLLGIGMSNPTLDWRNGLGDALCEFYDGDYWCSPVSPAVLRRLAAATGAVLWTSPTLPTAPSAGLAARGDFVFYNGNDNTLRRHTISSGVTSASLGSVPSGCRMALIGDILYITPTATDHAAGTTLVLRRYNIVTPGWLSDLSIPGLPVNVTSGRIFPAGGNILRVGGPWWHDIDVVGATITPLPFRSVPGHFLIGAGGGLKLWQPGGHTWAYFSTSMRPPHGLLWSVSDMRGQYLLSRIRLAAPITKDSTRTMKVIYDFNYL